MEFLFAIILILPKIFVLRMSRLFGIAQHRQFSRSVINMRGFHIMSYYENVLKTFSKMYPVNFDVAKKLIDILAVSCSICLYHNLLHWQ